MEIVPDHDPASHISARTAANRAVLLKINAPIGEAAEGMQKDHQFSSQDIQDESTGLVPRIDAGLDSAHRFAVLGAIFRPMRQFLRRNIDPLDESELSSSSESTEGSV